MPRTHLSKQQRWWSYEQPSARIASTSAGPLKVRVWKPKRVMPISTYTLILGIWKAIIKSSFMSRLSHKHYSAAITLDSWANFWFKNSPFVSFLCSLLLWDRIRRHCWDTSWITLKLWHWFVRGKRGLKAPGAQERTVGCTKENAHFGKAVCRIPWNELHIGATQILQRAFRFIAASFSQAHALPYTLVSRVMGNKQKKKTGIHTIVLRRSTIAIDRYSRIFTWPVTSTPCAFTGNLLNGLWITPHKENSNIPFSF